jgi:hypothetical protein
VTLGFLSQQIFFSPLFSQSFGYCNVIGCYSDLVGYFGIYFIVIISLVSFLSVPITKKRIDFSPTPNKTIFFVVLALVSMFGFVVLFLKSDGAILYAPKRDMMQYVSYDYIFWSLCSSLGFVSGVKHKNKFWSVFFLLSLLLTVYVGFRSVAALAIMAALLVSFSERSASSRNLSISKVILLLFVVVFFVFYKGFYAGLKLGNFDLVLSRAFDPIYYLSVVQNFEPVTNIAILSRTLESDFSIDAGNLIRLLSIPTLFMDSLFSDIPSFNDIFQPIFFPGRDSGAGSNVWAYFYAVGGWGLMLIFCFSYCLSLWVLSLIGKRSGAYLSTVVFLSASYWAFYIHRNDIVYQFNLQKRILIVFFVIYFLSFFVSKVSRR